jgi:CelD/BcsL family acetyltransferase involved in cellulose biosynthesis
VFSSFDEIEDLREHWDRLALESGQDIYTTYDWCATWWHHYGTNRRLSGHIWKNERLVAVAPLFQETLCLGPLSVRALRLCGCDHSVSTCGLLVDAERFGELLEKTAAGGRAIPDLVQLGPLAGYATGCESWAANQAALHGFQHSVCSGAPQMVFDLPPTFEDYVAQLPKKKRGELRREERDFYSQAGARVVLAEEPADVARALEEFIDLHQAYWRAEGRLGHFDDWPGCRDFHREMVRRQAPLRRVVFIQLKVGGETIASEYCYRFGRRMHWFLTARRREVSGRVGFCAMIRAAIDGGITQLDGMRGYYDYKKWLGARVVSQRSIVWIRNSALSALRRNAFRSAAGLLDLVYYRTWFSRLAPRLPLPRKPLRSMWIRSRL